ncbi:MAG: L-histidine N(alpha)-methyltransferase [Acidobacteria bacterium]|nr:MAG: L-histidine N(alpha)-methyltransferase [Acidobacteriota bacterium]
MTDTMQQRTAGMAAEVRQSLAGDPPSLPCKYFYDDRGSRLFQEITRLPEYYQTRTEEALLEAVADEVVGKARPRQLVELGSGSGRKIRLLLDAMARAGRLESCVLFDINERDLDQSVRALGRDYPQARVTGVVGDFTQGLEGVGPGGGRLAALLGGTIGNLHPRDVPPFLRRIAALLEPGGAFLLGVDLVKDKRVLEAAYDDAAGVTARFNRNILRVMNERLGADFDPEAFDHVAFYDEANAWIEMRLRARQPQHVRIPAADLDLRLESGDEIRTEISCKYTRGSLEERLRGTGLELDRWFTDRDDRFALGLLSPARA